ncbi:hypothetical protein D3C77_343860 [compost metagenome]
MLGQPMLDFPELNAESSNFDLMILAADEFDVAVRKPSAQITRFIQSNARRRRKRILHEGLLRPHRIVKISSSDRNSGHANFTDNPHGT